MGSENSESAQDGTEGGLKDVASEGRKQRHWVERSHLFERLRNHCRLLFRRVPCARPCFTEISTSAEQRSPAQQPRTTGLGVRR